MKKDQSEIDDDDLSDWKRNSKMRKMINSKNDEYVEYRIIKDDPADDEMIDNINSNGSSLFVECFVALLRLIINENGDWTCLVVEEWVEDKDIMELPIKNEENSNNVEEIKEEDAKSEDVDMIKQENSNEGATVKSEVSDVPNGTSNDNEKNYAVEMVIQKFPLMIKNLYKRQKKKKIKNGKKKTIQRVLKISFTNA